jgi:hypothetical protein
VEQSFSLQPFPSDAAIPDIAIMGVVRRHVDKVDIRYELSGDLKSIVIQPKEDIVIRKDNLWKETCLEAFLVPVGSEHYWEVNLSPSGHWNVYRFTAYREGMKEELALRGLPISVQRNDTVLTLSANIVMENLVSSEKPLYVGISAVIKSRKGMISYWALAHTGPEPDFHHRESFLVKI